MIYLLDANACIGWLRNNQPKLVARINTTPQDDLRLCSVVVGELVDGVERSSPTKRATNVARLALLRGLYTSLPYRDPEAEEYGLIRAYLAAAGRLIGHNDIMIAAIARLHGLTVVTHNTAEFGRVPGLLVEDWQ
jgi:tRNA(fMet)-specific endonuclease VapC